MKYAIQIIDTQEPMDAQEFYKLVAESKSHVLAIGNTYAEFVAKTVSIMDESEVMSGLRMITEEFDIVPFSQSVEVYTEGNQRIGAKIVVTPDVGSFNSFTLEMLCVAVEKGETLLTEFMQELIKNAVQR